MYVREFIGSMGSDAVLQRELRNNNRWTKERKYGKKYLKKNGKRRTAKEETKEAKKTTDDRCVWEKLPDRDWERTKELWRTPKTKLFLRTITNVCTVYTFLKDHVNP